MPMLALLLLMACLCGREADTREALQADARHSAPGARERPFDIDDPLLPLIQLRQGRIARLASEPPRQADGRQEAVGRALGVQLWDRVDDHWQLHRTIIIYLAVAK